MNDCDFLPFLIGWNIGLLIAIGVFAVLIWRIRH